MRCRGRERAFDLAWPLFSYDGPVRGLVSEYKKRRRRSLAPFIAELFAAEIGARWPDRVIVPVPARPGKARVQGWDQVEELARLLGKRGYPVARPLERRRSEEQKSLGRGDRGDNARLAYGLKAASSAPALPLLIDDVMTTCATLEACAGALKAGGALSVAALVLAAD
jgi:ComF family protein